MDTSLRDNIKYRFTYLAWLQALIATIGSLFFSEVIMLPPCELCWYQRIFMYPLVIILAVGMLLKDPKLKYYVLPLSITGFTIALYHNALYYHLIPQSVTPCTQGVSCTTVQLEWLGFITIPLLSLVAFGVITVAMWLAQSNAAKGNSILFTDPFLPANTQSSRTHQQSLEV